MKKNKKKNRFYYNKDFLSGSSGRSIRILSEYYGPLDRIRKNSVNDTIVFFGSARLRPKEIVLNDIEIAKKEGQDNIRQLEVDLKMSRYYEEAVKLASKLTIWSKELKPNNEHYIICSGGGSGIMEAANKGAAEAGGKNIGLTISLPFEDSGNQWISKNLNMKFHYFFMRKFWFVYLAKAIIVWPGGFGTLDELMEVLTLIQTGKIKKRLPIVLFGKEFWEKIVNWDYLVEIGTISENDLDLFVIKDNIEDTYNYVTNFIDENQLKGPNF